MYIFICGGGTGGHFFSGLALAEEFLKKYPESRVVFVGTRLGIEGRVKLSDPRMQIHFIAAKGMKGKRVFAKFLGIFYLILGWAQSLRLLMLYRPEIVFGVGGYASAPTCLAAWMTGFLKIWRLAVLEQNSSPGLVNRIFSKWGVSAFCAFPAKGFELIKLPIRQSTLEASQKARPIHWPPKTLFIAGGSQGARPLNQKWKEVVRALKPELSSLRLIHQTGRADEADLKSFYESEGFNAEVFAFSDEMPKYYETADLMICRSGAMTVFEVEAFKRPAIFIPFPHATDDHQRANALSVQDSDWVITESELNAERLRALILAPNPKIPCQKTPPQRGWGEIFESLLRRSCCS